LIAGGGVITAILTVMRYFDERRERRALVRQSFESTVQALGKDNDIEKMAAGILIRRFFDPKSEVGIKRLPFALDAVNVIASLLRSQDTGNFQKILADGLAYAPNLAHVDLQQANLRNAYLGPRKIGTEDVFVNVSCADFFQSDLSGASLKNAKALGAQFYESKLLGTVFIGADLRSANFYGADLQGAKLDKATLTNANFRNAKNLPEGLASALDEEGVFCEEEPFRPPKEQPGTVEIQVFISRPGVLVH
jgi:hypothetical protein